MTVGKVGLVDCSLRDGHQSLLATRMNTAQCMRVLPLLRGSGYRILELWGGATLDAALRFTDEDPFERLATFREALGDPARDGVSIRSLCRGQNLFGYVPCHDAVVCGFLKHAVRTGTDRIRIFDALNDDRNLITAIMATKTFNGHAEAAISYTTSPVHDVDHFIGFARRAIDHGADSLAIKDMAGLLDPATAFELIEALRRQWPAVPLTLHSHCTNGLAIASYIVGMLQGVDLLDVGYGPMAGATAQPPAELIGYFARELGIEVDVDLSLAPRIDAELRAIREELAHMDADPAHFGGPWPLEPDREMRKRIAKAAALLQKRDRSSIERAIAIIEDEIMVGMGYPQVDRSQLDAQVPGGMISNLHHQLKEQNQLDKMPRILEEIPRVRAAAGYVPLVTPTSQIVGTQAAFNVLQGEPYAMVTEPFRDLLMGRYGRLPAPPDPDVLKKVSRGQPPLTRRPATYVPPVDLDAMLREHGHLVRGDSDLLLLLMFPVAARKFLTDRLANDKQAVTAAAARG